MVNFRGFQIGQLPKTVYEWMQKTKHAGGLSQRQVVVAALIALATLKERDPVMFEAAVAEAVTLCPKAGGHNGNES